MVKLNAMQHGNTTFMHAPRQKKMCPHARIELSVLHKVFVFKLFC